MSCPTRSRWFRYLVFNVVPGAFLLGALPANSQEVVYWQGAEKCDALFDTPLPQLPNGSLLTNIKGMDAVQAHYAMASGGKIRLTVRKLAKIPVDGSSFQAAYLNIINEKPLQDAIARKTGNGVVLADVRNMIGVSLQPVLSEDEAVYTVQPSSLILSLTSKVRVLDWTGYEQANYLNRRLWGDHLCESAHHELGHIMVAAQILEESQDEWLAMQEPTIEALRKKQQALMNDIGQRIRERQDKYHDEIERMGPALSNSRPYLDLPFPWLVRDVVALPIGSDL